MGTSETQYAREVSIIDPKAKTFTLVSQNLSLCNIMKCNEEISYTVSPENPEKYVHISTFVCISELII